jgi:hypothetical protein
MTKLEVFNCLADCVSDLERQVWELPHSAEKLALEAITHRLDGLVDAVIEMQEENPREPA